ncbi:MAG: MBL fold metallo-hydrolase [Treponema sp.]|nr:MBL fold metallo-hydrolase [Treponema sp.]
MAEIHRIACGTDNCYIVAQGNDALLVDTGTAAFCDKVREACSRYTLKLIVLTHPHFDHAENAAFLSGHFSVPVAVHEADLELFENYDAQPLHSYGLVGKLVLGLSLKALRNTKVRRPQNLLQVKDGDSLAAYGFDAKIIGLPGHTTGSIGVDVEQKYLLAGDALDNWIRPAMGHLYCDYDAIKQTAGKIRSLGARTIFYGHGKPAPQSCMN